MKKIAFFILGVLLVWSVQARENSQSVWPLEDEAAAWTSVGPSGGNVSRMVMSPKNKKEIYALAGSDPGQVYRTTDSGGHWLRAGSLSEQIFDLALDPLDSRIVYALGGSGIYKTSDRGLHWTPCAFGENCHSQDGAIVVDPVNPGIIFASGYFHGSSGKTSIAILKSVDKGSHWTSQTIVPSSDYGRGYCLAINPENPSVLYVSGTLRETNTENVVYKSQNGGATWAKIADSISAKINGLAVDPVQPSNVYIATAVGVYRSANSGQSWQKNSGLVSAFALAIDGSNPDILYAGGSEICYKSQDGGDNWTEYFSGIKGSCRSLLAASNTVYFGSTAGVYKSVDAGLNWRSAHAGIYAAEVTLLMISPSSPNVLYANILNAGFYRSRNFGVSWTQLPYVYGCEGDGKVVGVHPDNQDIVYMIAPGEG